MKINIQKVVKCLTVFLAVAAVSLSALSPVAHAAEVTFSPIYDLSDYVVKQETDGTWEKVVFDFSSIQPLSVFYRNGNLQTSTFAPLPSWTTHPGWSSVTVKVFPLGVSNAVDTACRGGVMDVHDLTDGAPLNFHYTGSMELVTTSSDLRIQVSAGFYCFDENGNYLWVNREYQNYDHKDQGGIFTDNFDIEFSAFQGAKVRYIAPFMQYSVYAEDDDGNSGDSITMNWGTYTYTMSADVDMIAKQSKLMEAVKNKLGDIEDGLGDLNEKQDQTNEKLDDIISGGSAGDNLNDALDPTSPFGDASGELDDAMDDFENSSSKLPTTPTELPGVDSIIPTAPTPIDPTDLPGIPDSLPDEPDTPTSANPDGIDDYVTIAGNFMDWENSGLTYMYAPMVLSVSLAVLFYVVFGKAD